MREADYYDKAGYSFGQAYRAMAERIKLPFCPPSLDVFRAELTALNDGSIKGTSPQELAEMICLRAKAKGHARS